MRNLMFLFLLILTGSLITACGGNSSGPSTNEKTQAQKVEKPAANPKGIGEVKNVTLNDPLMPAMVEKGKSIYEMKCAACHKLSDQRVVGPGWKDITTRRAPEWIMNMTTNVEVMLEQDPAAQEMLKECLVRMPNQNLSIGDARDVLEFMYANDGKAVGE